MRSLPVVLEPALRHLLFLRLFIQAAERSLPWPGHVGGQYIRPGPAMQLDEIVRIPHQRGAHVQKRENVLYSCSLA
ncbi:hypothetical protein RY27_25385 [Litorilinea aerophila]|nr:hypothetical protein RY27_25385 [Litorilinea aerophila]